MIVNTLARLLLITLLIAGPAVLQAEEEEAPTDEASLALDPPDAANGESDLARDLDESDQKDAEDRENKTRDAEVANIEEDTFAAREGNEQIKLLKYHKQIIADRDRLKASGQEDAPHTFHFALGGLFTTVTAPGAEAEFQVGFSEHWSFGVVGNLFPFADSNGSVLGVAFSGGVSTIGGLATFNYYSRRAYEGIWVQAGAGFDSFRVGSLAGDTIINTPPFVFNMGWRFLNETNNLTFAFTAGSRVYFFSPEPEVFFTLRLQVGLAWNIFPH